uniref:Uncharacterized protein n=1 Tax=Haptolina brevifila TaxID=156173 RepID=A0A7S2JE13_9EUKA
MSYHTINEASRCSQATSNRWRDGRACRAHLRDHLPQATLPLLTAPEDRSATGWIAGGGTTLGKGRCVELPRHLCDGCDVAVGAQLGHSLLQSQVSIHQAAGGESWAKKAGLDPLGEEL